MLQHWEGQKTVKCPNNFDLDCSHVAIAQNSIFLAKSRKKGMRKNVPPNQLPNETDFTKSMIRFQSQYPTEVIILAKGLVRGLKHKPFSPAYLFK